MQGFEAPANSWERQILARRVADYDPKVLDHLCLTGAVGWGRVSPHPATLETVSAERRRVVPTSVAPITFFVREDADWMIPHREAGEEEMRGLSPAAKAVMLYLRQRGASFFADIVRGTGKLKAEVETAPVGARCGGIADGGRLRQLEGADRSETAFRAGQWEKRAAATQCRAMVAAVCGRSGGSHPGAGSHLLDAASPLWNRVPRGSRPRDDPAEVARGADHLKASGRSWRGAEAEDSSVGFWESNSRCRWRWSRCERSGMRQRLGKWLVFRRRTHSISWESWCRASAWRRTREDSWRFAMAWLCRRVSGPGVVRVGWMSRD